MLGLNPDVILMSCWTMIWSGNTQFGLGMTMGVNCLLL
ncbi:hypothetical protein JCM19233_3344 [Vibrio astriarenae]|nr:hypothetical protein JCM19233_3344 [Vibrio sp. C7]